MDIKEKNKLKVFEAFAGVGSQSMALRNIGVNYEVVGTMDVDKYAILAYDSIHNEQVEIPKVSKDDMLKEINRRHICYNFSTGKSEIPKKEEEIKNIYDAHIRNKNYGDVSLINPKELPDFDFFTYSFPCKNISNAGQQAGFKKDSGTQSSLVWECEKVIRYKKPKYLMMENVKNIVSKNHIDDFNEWCNILDNLGYNNYWKILNGKNFNVPQNRERVIMISILKSIDVDLFEMPTKCEKENGIHLLDILEQNVSDEYFYDTNKNEGFITYKLNNIVHIREATKKGYSVVSVGDSLNLEQPNSKTRRGRVGHGIANTLTTSCNQAVLQSDYRIRKLTPLECWRCLGFSDDDFYKAKKVGLPEIKLYERAGRGIVVPMLEEIFKRLFIEYI